MPAFGSCCTTIPARAGSVTCRFTDLTPYPAPLRILRASASFRPTTLGTVRRPGGPETFSRTVEPRGARVPAFGDCETTVPCGWGELTGVGCGPNPPCLILAIAA